MFNIHRTSCFVNTICKELWEKFKMKLSDLSEIVVRRSEGD